MGDLSYEFIWDKYMKNICNETLITIILKACFALPLNPK